MKAGLLFKKGNEKSPKEYYGPLLGFMR